MAKLSRDYQTLIGQDTIRNDIFLSYVSWRLGKRSQQYFYDPFFPLMVISHTIERELTRNNETEV